MEEWICWLLISVQVEQNLKDNKLFFPHELQTAGNGYKICLQNVTLVE